MECNWDINEMIDDVIWMKGNEIEIKMKWQQNANEMELNEQ